MEISYIWYQSFFWYDIRYDTIYDICSFAAADPAPAQRADANDGGRHERDADFDRRQLQTFGCIQWECELYSGRPKARGYPFNMKGHRFRGKKCQVHHMIWYHIWYHCYAMISFVMSYMISCCKQDCVVVLTPYPNNQHSVESFNVKTNFGF